MRIYLGQSSSEYFLWSVDQKNTEYSFEPFLSNHNVAWKKYAGSVTMKTCL